MKTRLEEIRERAEKASPGPWEPCIHLRGEADKTCGCGYRGGVWSKAADVILLEMGCTRVDGVPFEPEAPREKQIADALFVAHAREDVPWLLGLLEAERKRHAEEIRQMERDGREEIRDAAADASWRASEEYEGY